MILLRFCVLALVAFFSGKPAVSHEFWIDPVEYQVSAGAPIIADLRVGEAFSGSTLVWSDRAFTRFEVATGETIKPVESPPGAQPAMNTTAPGDGLAVVLLETTPLKLRYAKWEKFVSFVTHKDAAWAVAEHRAAGWPETGFQESYTRHVKALVAVGAGDGNDRAYGTETEFVALTNPYSAGFGGTMRVQLLYNGRPRANAQVEVFERAPDGVVAKSTHQTDSSGRAAVSVQPGHSYLFDAVVLRPADTGSMATSETLWESLWAALTFSVPIQ